MLVEARGAVDMDLFVLRRKLDAYGMPLQAFTVPNQSAMAHELTDHGASILRYTFAESDSYGILSTPGAYDPVGDISQHSRYFEDRTLVAWPRAPKEGLSGQ